MSVREACGVCCGILLLALLPGCSLFREIQHETEETRPGGDMEVSFDLDDCTPGTLVCDCKAGGVCNPGLVCAAVSEICVEPGALDMGDPPDLGESGVVKLALGHDHTCAVLDGAVFCWGGNTMRQSGPFDSRDQLPPQQIAGLGTVDWIAAGDEFTCVVNADKQLKCWGSDLSDRRGDGMTVATSGSIGQVESSLSFERVWSGYGHSCALTTTGDAYCWGIGNEGQLGAGERPSEDRPRKVAGTVRFRLLSTGKDHTCGLTEGGEVYCWGRSAEGQLGLGQNVAALTPSAIAVPGAVSVASGLGHSCAVRTNKSVYCWGLNAQGQVGVSTEQRSVFMPVEINGINNAQRVVAGDSFSCALLYSGRVFCWGDNAFGQLGRGDSSMSTTFSIEALPVEGIEDAVSLAASSEHACAVTATGKILCWGRSESGEIRPSQERFYTPTEVIPEPTM